MKLVYNKKIIITAVAFIMALFGGMQFDDYHHYDKKYSTQQENVIEMVHVVRVIDGDTIILSDGRRVRYIGIDTPETGKGYTHKKECFAPEATARNRKLVEGKDVKLYRDISDTDKYGRLLRHVYVGDQWINAELVRGGYAQVKYYKPDISRAKDLRVIEKIAQKNHIGMWNACQ